MQNEWLVSSPDECWLGCEWIGEEEEEEEKEEEEKEEEEEEKEKEKRGRADPKTGENRLRPVVLASGPLGWGICSRLRLLHSPCPPQTAWFQSPRPRWRLEG